MLDREGGVGDGVRESRSSIKSRRIVSFEQRHLAVDLLRGHRAHDADAPGGASPPRWSAGGSSRQEAGEEDDPRLARSGFQETVSCCRELQFGGDLRIDARSTRRRAAESTLACGIDHVVETRVRLRRSTWRPTARRPRQASCLRRRGRPGQSSRAPDQVHDCYHTSRRRAARRNCATGPERTLEPGDRRPRFRARSNRGQQTTHVSRFLASAATCSSRPPTPGPSSFSASISSTSSRPRRRAEGSRASPPRVSPGRPTRATTSGTARST